MKLIAVISHKGGAGKTTSAVQLAEELARRGQRTLLVDADRQQGAGLLLGIDAPAGCVQRTMVGDLSYLGSARLTDLEIADCYSSVASRFDVGVVDTPSLDDVLARAWLRESAAALMVLQVDPLTVKTLPSALNTLEVVKAFKPTIQVLGLLPTMFDQGEEAHSRLLAELLARRPEAVFTPVVPVDSGLRHRANQEANLAIGESARQAYQCAVDRILRVLNAAEPTPAQPQSQTRMTPPWQQAPVQSPAAYASAAPTAAAPASQSSPAAPSPGSHRPAAPVGGHQQPVTAPTGYQQQAAAVEAVPHGAPAAQQPTPVAAPAVLPNGLDAEPAGFQQPAAAAAAPVAEAAPQPPTEGSDLQQSSDWEDETEPALETLASSRVEPRAAEKRKRRGSGVPDWYQEARVDSGGVVRRPDSWLARSRFAIACTIACLALVAAVVMGTLKRGPLTVSPPGKSLAVDAAVAAIREKSKEKAAEKNRSKKSAVQKKERSPGNESRTGKAKGTQP